MLDREKESGYATDREVAEAKAQYPNMKIVKRLGSSKSRTSKLELQDATRRAEMEAAEAAARAARESTPARVAERKRLAEMEARLAGEREAARAEEEYQRYKRTAEGHPPGALSSWGNPASPGEHKGKV